MSKPPSTPSSSRPSSRPGSLRALDIFASSRSLRSFRINASHDDLSIFPSQQHFYDKREVPYPLSIDKETLELYSVDRALMYCVKNSCSFINFNGSPPKRCLDLGTGLGDWCIDAAKGWPECTFVGFDIADVQLDLKYIDPSLASRIQWVHGNFLERLPFDDNEFDYVHLFGTAFAVPEDKWHFFLDEINRVLKPGGQVEAMEEDATFPILPRWFTTPLRRQSRRPLLNSKSSISLMSGSSDELPHEYALLEMLFYSAFESRFVNPTPCSILPGYFSATFSHIISPPILLFPMPPLAPLPPFPESSRMHNTSSRSRRNIPQQIPEDTHVAHVSEFSLPPIASTVPLDTQLIHLAPKNTSISSMPTSDSSSSNTGSTRHTFELERLDADSPSAEGRNSYSSSMYDAPPRPLGAVAMPAFAGQAETTQMGGKEAYDLFSMDNIAGLDEHAAYTHLMRMARLVYSAKDAMLDELMSLVAQGDITLEKYGWDEEDYTEEISREKFELLWQQYQDDMHMRISLWHPMTKYGWKYPRRNTMSKAEIMDEERLRRAILEARRLAKEDEIQPTMRAIRLLVGTKDPDLPHPTTL